MLHAQRATDAVRDLLFRSTTSIPHTRSRVGSPSHTCDALFPYPSPS
jgi:hypothetical protein